MNFIIIEFLFPIHLPSILLELVYESIIMASNFIMVFLASKTKEDNYYSYYFKNYYFKLVVQFKCLLDINY